MFDGAIAIFTAGVITLGAIWQYALHLHEKNQQLKLEDFIEDTTYDELKTKKSLKSSMFVEEFDDGKKVTLSGDKVLNLPKGKGVRFVVTRDSETSYRSEFLDFVHVKN